MASRARPVVAIVITVALTLLAFVAITRGIDAWQSGDERPTSGDPQLPATLWLPPPTVATTEDHGPVGPVSTVFAAETVRDGLSGRLDNPWIAVSGIDGEYRAISQPDLPSATRGAAVRVSPDGRMLAWPASDALVLYDAVRDTVRKVPTQGRAEVGAFSPDGEWLLVNDGTLTAVPLADGEPMPIAADVPRAATAGAAWVPDGQQVTWIAFRTVVTAAIDGSVAFQRSTTLPQSTMLAWSPSGTRLFSLDREGGTLRSFLRRGDDLRPAGAVDRAPGIYLERPIGFAGQDQLVMIGLNSTAGTQRQLLRLDLTRPLASPLTDLPLPAIGGANSLDTDTLSFASEALAAPAEAFEPPADVWSDRSVLTGLIITALCLLGFYFTRRARRGRG